jgi:hypothetical protein
MDSIVEYELVLPNGQVTVVTEKEEDLWFALKVRLSSGKQGQFRTVMQGGFNNYVSVSGSACCSCMGRYNCTEPGDRYQIHLEDP